MSLSEADDQTTLDTFAAFALGGIVAGDQGKELSAQDVAACAYDYASAMMQERDRRAVLSRGTK